MKPLISLTLILTSTFNLFAQDYSKLKEIKLSDSLSCLQAQPKVLECCNYLLTTPCKDKINSLNATQFIIQWMDATPNYTFGLDNNFFQALKSDFNLTARYYASLAKTALENNITENNFELQFDAVTKLLEYSEKKSNEVEIHDKLQKYIDAKNNNTLKILLPN